jgi:hypothetical protein
MAKRELIFGPSIYGHSWHRLKRARQTWHTCPKVGFSTWHSTFPLNDPPHPTPPPSFGDLGTYYV